jgi:putative membrane protein
MQASLLGTAVFAWRELLTPGVQLRSAVGHVVLICLMGLLGGLITFAPAPLYAPHFLTAELYGLTPLEDQQLAGLVMWVPAIVPNLVAALFCVFRLAEAEGVNTAGRA